MRIEFYDILMILSITGIIGINIRIFDRPDTLEVVRSRDFYFFRFATKTDDTKCPKIAVPKKSFVSKNINSIKIKISISHSLSVIDTRIKVI